MARLRWARVMLGGVLALAGGCTTTTPPTRAEPEISAPSTAAIDPNDESWTDADRAKQVESFDIAWSRIRDTHWDKERTGASWDEARARLRPRVESAASRQEARRAIQELIQSLKQSHFGLIPGEVYQTSKVGGTMAPSAARGKRNDPSAPASGPASTAAFVGGTPVATPKSGEAGMDIRIVGDDVVVTRVWPGSAAEAAGLRPGHALRRVGGEAMAPRLAMLRERLEPSTLKTLMMVGAINRLYAGHAGDRFTIVAADPDGQVSEHTLTLRAPEGPGIKILNLPEEHVRFITQTRPSGVGYAYLSIFLDVNLVPRFAAAVRQWRDAPGIIVDLRGNPGGIGGMGMGLGGALINQSNLKLGTMRMRESELHLVLNRRVGSYDGPVAVLVDELSASTSEFLAGGLQSLGRARVFGALTAGAALPSMIEELPSGDRLQYAIADYVRADGKPLEGVGVTPDALVQPDRRSLWEGRDPVIEAAEAWILAQRTAPQDHDPNKLPTSP